MLRKSTILIITLSLTLSFTSSIFAAPTKQSLTKQQQALEAQKDTLNDSKNNSILSFEDAKKEVDSINSQIEGLDFKIEGLTTNIADSNAQIAAKVLEIKVAEEKLAKNLADLEKEQALYNSRIRTMYIEGPAQNLTVLLGSKNLDDFFTNLEAVKYISKIDKEITKDLADTKTSITETKATLETENALLVTANQNLLTKLDDLKNSKAQQSTLIVKAKARQALYASQIAGYQAQIDAADKEASNATTQLNIIIAAEKKAEEDRANAAKNPTNTAPPDSTVSTSSASGNALIAYASRFMGTTYVWGGTQPSPGFDCSGFMQYVYAHFGIHISRTTYTQIYEGRSVARNQLQPGDLIFFGTYSNPHHVAMYIGNNCVIHAPHTGDVIKVSSLSAFSDYLCARRILN